MNHWQEWETELLERERTFELKPPRLGISLAGKIFWIGYAALIIGGCCWMLWGRAL